ncbi:MAG: LuxR C-terminal-related transcriptional regulator [Clostridia bacterium]|nr:LuxR C-terminal-related transcriptional regulator [Clostridia bacterium]
MIKKLDFKRILFLSLFLVLVVFILPKGVSADEVKVIETQEDLVKALTESEDGATIYVSDIDFKKMPMGMVVVTKNVTIKSGKETHAEFRNATFALNGTATDASPLTVKFSGIDFIGDNTDMENPNVSSSGMEFMKTMCAGIFKMNVDATYEDCIFRGYHYGYGGVFNAIYSSDDNKNELKLNLNSCTFMDNAGKYGGAIYLTGRNHNITLNAKHCSFFGNRAATGGAIYADVAVLNLLDCSFSDNGGLSLLEGKNNGGALSLINCSTELNGCLVAGNAAQDNGGGIYAEISPFRTLMLLNTTVRGNRAESGSGLAVVPLESNFDTKAEALVYYSTFAYNGDDEKLPENDNAEFSCCIFEGSSEQIPSKENGYNAVTSKIKEGDLSHLTSEEKYTVGRDVQDSVLSGRLKLSLGELLAGDNYMEKFDLKIKTSPARTEILNMKYGDNLNLNIRDRMLYRYDGMSVSTDSVFLGGIMPENPVKILWKPKTKPLLIAVLVPVALIITLFAMKRRGEKIQNDMDWRERAMDNPEVQEKLTDRELDVLALLLLGKTREEIAEALYITDSTVKKHASSIYQKLGVKGKAELIAKLARK